MSDVISASPSSAPLKSSIKNWTDTVWALDYLLPHLRDLGKFLCDQTERGTMQWRCEKKYLKHCENALSHLSWLTHSLPKMSFRKYNENIPLCALKKTKKDVFFHCYTLYYF